MQHNYEAKKRERTSETRVSAALQFILPVLFHVTVANRVQRTHTAQDDSFFFPSQYLLFRSIAHVRVNGWRLAGRRG